MGLAIQIRTKCWDRARVLRLESRKWRMGGESSQGFIYVCTGSASGGNEVGPQDKTPWCLCAVPG